MVDGFSEFCFIVLVVFIVFYSSLYCCLLFLIVFHIFLIILYGFQNVVYSWITNQLVILIANLISNCLMANVIANQMAMLNIKFNSYSNPLIHCELNDFIAGKVGNGGLWLVCDWSVISLWLVCDWFVISLWFVIGLWLEPTKPAPTKPAVLRN